MTDDIVTRLRESCAHLCAKCDRENAYGVAVDAADEIERLRGELLDSQRTVRAWEHAPTTFRWHKMTTGEIQNEYDRLLRLVAELQEALTDLAVRDGNRQ